ncbi:MAG TPA: hypothetical protein VN065_13355, partial [Bradyrhizobium sp.]|nr:hypothetical protein [Bradyrhizobium sp.]
MDDRSRRAVERIRVRGIPREVRHDSMTTCNCDIGGPTELLAIFTTSGWFSTWTSVLKAIGFGW